MTVVKKNFLVLAASVFLAQAIGWLASVFTVANIETWYVLLEKPSFNPPNWLFAPVWTALYLLMALAAYFVWISKEPQRRSAIVWYLVQLLLNFFWSVVFFGAHSPAGALIIIVVLLAAIGVTTVKFWRIKPLAGYLMLPYVVWTSFAFMLNYFLWLLN